MSSELKTFKDFPRMFTGANSIDYILNEIKQEAIKWYNRSDGNKHKFIKEFFNIIEEDLVDTNGE